MTSTDLSRVPGLGAQKMESMASFLQENKEQLPSLAHAAKISFAYHKTTAHVTAVDQGDGSESAVHSDASAAVQSMKGQIVCFTGFRSPKLESVYQSSSFECDSTCPF